MEITTTADSFASRAENIHLRFKALAQAQIMRADLEPAAWLLVEIQPAADLDDGS